MPVVTVRDGTELYYRDWGRGPLVVLLGAAVMNSRMWESLAYHLAGNGFRCVAYDRRGTGRSDWPWSGYDYDTLADDLAHLLEHLDARDAALVGYGVGGGEAVRYLARDGDARVSSLVLASSTTPIIMKSADNPDGTDVAVFEQTIAAAEQDRARWVAELVAPFFGGSDGSPNTARPPWSVRR
ncbi:non-heme chloroperoxidase [Frankia sp. AiPs1]|uniref:alpha/beta fold hydrolase n=1 Tax=Frankia sp. AiPa1 TaxID=573492 RepID=UPI00202B2174|nr:alpha/beta fold hydrolase [Frankia sp. AiPa1]MCL9759493.1 alpha/beta hydrolase [Frankia sp. AiPa1]